MAEFSQLFRDDPEFLSRALAAYDEAHPEARRREAPPEQPLAAASPPPTETPPSSAPQRQVDMVVLRPVERPTGSLGQQQQQLAEEQLASSNEAAESFQREGEAKAAGSSRAAEIYGKQAILADRYAEALERRYKDSQERADKYNRMADEDFERLREEPPRPGALKNAFNVITGIIGAAAGGTTGDALQMLRAHVNREAQQDAEDRMAAKERIEVGQRIHDRILDESTNALDAGAKLVANQWLVASRQLEQIANESNVPAFREQALRLSLAARDQARGELQQNVAGQIQQRAAARAAALRTRWESMTEQELEALQRAGVLPIEGAERLAELRIKQRKASGEEDKAQASAALKQEAAKSLRLYESAEADARVLRDQISKLEAKGSNDVPGVGPLAGWLPNGLTSAEGVRLRQAAKKVLKAQLRDESGAAIGEDELEAYMNDRGMSETATNADFYAGMKNALSEFELKRAIARQAAGQGDGTPETSPAANYAELEARLGARPRGAR